MAQGIGLCHMGNLVHRLQTEGAARGCEQNLLNGILVFAYQRLEDSRVLAVDRQDGCMVLLCQLQYQLTSHHQCLLIGQGNGFLCLDGMDGGRQASKTHHGSEHHVDGVCLNNLIQRLCTGIDLHVGQVVHQPAQVVVTCFIGNNHSGRLELMSLLCQQFYLVIGCQTVHLVQVGVLLNHLEGLSAYRPSGAEYCYLSFHDVF